MTLAPDSRSGPSRAKQTGAYVYISSHRCTWDRMRPSIPVSGGSATGCFGMFRSRSGYRTRSSTRERTHLKQPRQHLPSWSCSRLAGTRTTTTSAAQAETAWCLHLGSIWGFAQIPRGFDPEGYVKDARAEVDRRLQALGFLRTDGTQDQAAIKRAGFGHTRRTPVGARCRTGKNSDREKRKRLSPSVDFRRTGLSDTGCAKNRDKQPVSGDRDSCSNSPLRIWIDGGVRGGEGRRYLLAWSRSKGVRDPIWSSPKRTVEFGRVSHRACAACAPAITCRRGLSPEEHDCGVRGCFKARPGQPPRECGLRGAEFSARWRRCHLWVVGHSEMAQAINESGDPGLLQYRFAARSSVCSPSTKCWHSSREEETLRQRAGGKLRRLRTGFPVGWAARSLCLRAQA